MTSDCNPTMAPIRMWLQFVEMLMCCVFLIICQCFYDKLLNIQAVIFHVESYTNIFVLCNNVLKLF